MGMGVRFFQFHSPDARILSGAVQVPWVSRVHVECAVGAKPPVAPQAIQSIVKGKCVWAYDFIHVCSTGARVLANQNMCVVRVECTREVGNSVGGEIPICQAFDLYSFAR